MFTTKKITQRTASTVIPSSTPTFANKIKAPGAAKKIFTKNTVYFDTVPSLTTTFTTTRRRPKATKKILTDNSYTNEKLDSQKTNNEYSSIYFLIALPILAILILLVMVGTIFYWRR